MSYGFKVATQAGEIVVDDTNVTLSVVARGTLNYVSGMFYNSAQRYYLYRDTYFGMVVGATFPAVITSQAAPMVVLIPDSPAGAIHSYQPIGSPGAWTGFEIGYSHLFRLPGDGRYTSIPHINWRYVVARIDTVVPSLERWGIRVFNEQGAVTFDSNVRTIRLRQYLKEWSGTQQGTWFREYAMPWNFSFDGEHGLLVSNLGAFEAFSGNFTAAYASTRYGFTDSSTVRSWVGGLTSLDVNRMNQYGGGGFTSLVANTLQQQIGGPKVFAVQVM